VAIFVQTPDMFDMPDLWEFCHLEPNAAL